MPVVSDVVAAETAGASERVQRLLEETIQVGALVVTITEEAVALHEA